MMNRESAGLFTLDGVNPASAVPTLLMMLLRKAATSPVVSPLIPDTGMLGVPSVSAVVGSKVCTCAQAYCCCAEVALAGLMSSASSS